jgi:glycosyltransferase involved in cell wall biosynthesis
VQPQVTVVIPAWDAYAGAQLTAAIRSVLEQDAPHAIVVVDNASISPVPAPGDATLVRVPRRVSLGAARNAGLDQVATPWVVFWDADDVMFPGTLSALLSAAGNDHDAVALVAGIVDSATGREYRWPRRWMRRLARLPRLFAPINAVWSLYPTTGASLLRTDAVRAAGGFAPSDNGDDWALGVSLAFRGRVSFIDHRGRWYSQDPGSLSATWRPHPHLVGNARVARERFRLDRGVPRAARVVWPLVALGQLTIILVIRPLLGRGKEPQAGRRAGIEPAPALEERLAAEDRGGPQTEAAKIA